MCSMLTPTNMLWCNSTEIEIHILLGLQIWLLYLFAIVNGLLVDLLVWMIHLSTHSRDVSAMICKWIYVGKFWSPWIAIWAIPWKRLVVLVEWPGGWRDTRTTRMTIIVIHNYVNVRTWCKGWCNDWYYSKDQPGVYKVWNIVSYPRTQAIQGHKKLPNITSYLGTGSGIHKWFTYIHTYIQTYVHTYIDT